MALNFANAGAGLQSTDAPDGDAAWARIHELLVDLYPVKTAFHLSDITGLSVSGWQKSIREKRALSPGALLSLLRAPFRMQILEALLGATDFNIMIEEAQLEAKRQELQERRKALREKP